ncbi:MAG: NADH-quinone oxidoreductase subunit J [Planctomycetes bacterium]|nr:NADH-quinone oxidoreductase subunit J [Planctomycetota bacterium]
MDFTTQDFFFLLFAAIAFGCSLLCVTRRNPVYSAAFLVMAFIPIAAIYVMLQAAFVALMQVMVYAGAIMVLFIFVIMMLNLKPLELFYNKPPAYIIGSLLLIGMIGLVTVSYLFGGNGIKPLTEKTPTIADAIQTRDENGEIALKEVKHEPGSPGAVGLSLFQKYPLQFELASVLILVAIVGAVVLAKKGISDSGEEGELRVKN